MVNAPPEKVKANKTDRAGNFFPCENRQIEYNDIETKGTYDLQKGRTRIMKLTDAGLRNRQPWAEHGVKLPEWNRAEMIRETEKNPVWVHFGAGNIFRGFIAGLQQRLLDQGLARQGILAAETFDHEIIDRIYQPYDALTLMVSLKPDGSTDREVIASLAKGLKASPAETADWQELVKAFTATSLQMASFTITEKGYALRDLHGNLFPVVVKDMEEGPSAARHAMSVVTALMLERYRNGKTPMALVSMDNCSHNGEKLRAAVLEIAEAWAKAGFADAGFLNWISDEQQVSFPWSMIDKITPRPADSITRALTEEGFEDMAPIQTEKHTYIAPFVNAEVPQYLVVEDRFPNGRPALEKAGVYMTDRETVNKTERMKVTTCLNPLHTALAVYGCLLGYTLIADEMKDPDLKRLVERIGYIEGLPVVTDPGILSPKAFLKEVLEQRLPNPFMPDTPQRIACDTSQKVPIRFGETIKSRLADGTADRLEGIPLAIAAWLRYLLAADDEGKPMEVSPDPMKETLQEALSAVKFGNPESAEGVLQPILANTVVFATDLTKTPLAEKIEKAFREMLIPGGVRKSLKRIG